MAFKLTRKTAIISALAATGVAGAAAATVALTSGNDRHDPSSGPHIAPPAAEDSLFSAQSSNVYRAQETPFAEPGQPPRLPRAPSAEGGPVIPGAAVANSHCSRENFDVAAQGKYLFIRTMGGQYHATLSFNERVTEGAVQALCHEGRVSFPGNAVQLADGTTNGTDLFRLRNPDGITVAVDPNYLSVTQGVVPYFDRAPSTR